MEKYRVHGVSSYFEPPLVELQSKTANYHLIGFMSSSKERDKLDEQIATLGKILSSAEGLLSGGLQLSRKRLDEALLSDKPAVEKENKHIESMMREYFMRAKDKDGILDFMRNHPEIHSAVDWMVHVQDVPFKSNGIQLGLKRHPVTTNPYYLSFPGWGYITRVFRNLPLKDNLTTVAVPDTATSIQCSKIKDLVDATYPHVDVVKFKTR